MEPAYRVTEDAPRIADELIALIDPASRAEWDMLERAVRRLPAAVHNGMRDDPDVPRFGRDDPDV